MSVAVSSVTVPAGAVWVDVTLIAHDNYRSTYDAAHVANLAADIGERGLEQLPCVRAVGFGYVVVWGNTRIAAMRDVLGWATVPVQVREFDGAASVLDAQVRENELRREVPRGDRARVAVRMRDEHGYSAADVASRLSCSVVTVRDYWQLADRLSPRSLEAWSVGDLTMSAAKELCRCDADRQHAIVDLCRSQRFSVAAFDALIEKVVAAQTDDAATGMFDADMFSLQVQDMAADVTVETPKTMTRSRLEARVLELERLLEQSATATVSVTVVTVGVLVIDKARVWADALTFEPKRAYANGCIDAYCADTVWPTVALGSSEWAGKVTRKLASWGIVPRS